MKVLVLTSALRQPDNRLLWEGLKNYCAVDIHFIQKEQQDNLRRYLSSLNIFEYDWVVSDLFFKKICRQASFFRSLPRLIIYEEDACQEFIAGSKWKGKFSTFYKKIPHARVVITGRRIAEKFRESGVDAHFMPKGYDSSALYDSGSDRDIEFGFVGRLASNAYRGRREFLELCADGYGLKILRTDPGEAYRVTLNQIRVFVSADIGLGEYMAKNFEAMACGCLLLAYRQGDGEEMALGLEDGVNSLLYSDFIEFSEKVAWLEADKARANAMAARGCALAQEKFDYCKQAEAFFAFLVDPPRGTKKCFWSKLQENFRRQTR